MSLATDHPVAERTIEMQRPIDRARPPGARGLVSLGDLRGGRICLMPSIFISYSHTDAKFARTLARDLKLVGAKVWIDEGELKVGDSLIPAITSAIDRIDFLTAILSSRSVKSRWVEEELNMAITGQIDGKPIKVLPVLIEDCEVPGFLRTRVYADFRHANQYEVALEKLMSAMELYFLPGWLRTRLEKFAGRGQAERIRSIVKRGNTKCPACGNSLHCSITKLEDSILFQLFCYNKDFPAEEVLLFTV
jgi:hypothetical protein